MKAMILAAGRGERMRPLTDTTPKPLLQVGSKALIEYHIEGLRAANINEIVINHAWLGSQIVDALGDGERYGVSIHYSAEPPGALDTAGGIINALAWLGAAPFVVINGDVWTDYPFAQLPQTLVGKAHLVMVNNPPQHADGDFFFDAARLNTAGPGVRLTYSGIGVYSPALFEGLTPEPAPLAPLLRSAMEQGQVSAEHYEGQWFDIGTPARLDALNLELRATR